MAYGILGLKPWELDAMTPGEFASAYEGYMWKEERDQKQRAANLAAIVNLCSPNLKKGKRFHVKDFYKPSNLSPKNPYYRGFVGK